MAEALHTHAQDLADYLNENVLDHDELSSADMLEALAKYGDDARRRSCSRQHTHVLRVAAPAGQESGADTN